LKIFFIVFCKRKKNFTVAILAQAQLEQMAALFREQDQYKRHAQSEDQIRSVLGLPLIVLNGVNGESLVWERNARWKLLPNPTAVTEDFVDALNQGQIRLCSPDQSTTTLQVGEENPSPYYLVQGTEPKNLEQVDWSGEMPVSLTIVFTTAAPPFDATAADVFAKFAECKGYYRVWCDRRTAYIPKYFLPDGWEYHWSGYWMPPEEYR